MGLKPVRKLHFPPCSSLFVERGFLYAHYRVGQFRGLFRFGGSRSDTVKDFPPIRVFGTVGFICSMGRRFGRYAGECGTVRLFRCSELVVGGLRPDPSGMSGKPCGGTQERGGGFGASCLYAVPAKAYGLVFHLFHVSGHLFADNQWVCQSFIFSFGGFPNMRIRSGVQHANILISISQISETFCILLIPFFFGAFRHQAGDAHSDVGMGVPFRVLRVGQSRVGRVVVCPVHAGLRGGFRLFQCLGFLVCRQGDGHQHTQ